MSVKMSSYQSTLTAFIEGDIDHHTSKEIRETIDSYAERYNPKLLELDFSKVQFMDTSGIGLIMGRFKLMIALRGNLKVINIPKNLERMIKLSGLGTLGILENREETNYARSNQRNEYKFF